MLAPEVSFTKQKNGSQPLRVIKIDGEKKSVNFCLSFFFDKTIEYYFALTREFLATRKL